MISERHQYWEDAALGRPVDWEKVFEGFVSTVDWPYCSFYEDLATRYPQAKVILTVRNADAWYESISNTIFALLMASAANPASPVERASRVTIWDLFNGHLTDRDHVIAVYERHNSEVKARIPAERLLAFDVREGWEPLFLKVPVPDASFPRVNDSDAFKSNAETFVRQARALPDGLP